MVEQTLEAMRRGGIYDHVGFGFHRYATDPQWLVPHFEKMLYDQAMLEALNTHFVPNTIDGIDTTGPGFQQTRRRSKR